MRKLHFIELINAPRNKVWSVLWQDDTYRQWTSAFTEGSDAESDWKEGGKIVFLGPNGDGLLSEIEKLVPNEKMVFRHLGMMKNGQEYHDKSSEEWKGAREAYTLVEKNGGTGLNVDLDATDADAEYFAKSFPAALAIVRKLAEK